MKKTHFGVSLDFPAQLSASLSPEFSVLAIPGGWLENTELGRKLSRLDVEWIVRDVYDASLCRLLPGEKHSMRLDFGEYLREMCERALGLGISTGVGMFDLSLAVQDMEYRKNLFSLLRSCYRTWREEGWTQLLPLRLPGNDPDVFAGLLREMMFDSLRWSLELYPHEPGFAALDPEKIWPRLAFRVGAMHIHYQPETGNHLAAKPLLPWIRRALRTECELCVLFVPDGMRQENSARRLEELAHLIQELRGMEC